MFQVLFSITTLQTRYTIPIFNIKSQSSFGCRTFGFVFRKICKMAPNTGSATPEQIDTLLNFLDEHRDLARGRLRSLEGKVQAKRLWEELCNTLNSMGGCTKTVQQWQKVWFDRKHLAKKAAADSRRLASMTGGGPSVAPQLSHWELKVLAIMGDGFGDRQTGARVPAFSEIHESIPSTSSQGSQLQLQIVDLPEEVEEYTEPSQESQSIREPASQLPRSQETLTSRRCITSQVNSYVLLQVRKDGQNRSNVDALIHKVVSPGELDVLTKKIARKQFSAPEPKKESVQESQEFLQLEEPNLKDLVKKIMNEKPEFRTSDFHIKPKVIKFRSNQPSLMYEVDSNVLIRALKDFLSSKLVAKYTDNLAKQAAVVYRTVKKGLNNY